MAKTKSFQVEIPDNLRRKLASLERKLFVVDTAIALSGVVAGLVVSWMLLYLSDRFWATPAHYRLAFTLAGIGVAAIFVWPWVRHWILKRRDRRILAAIVQQKHRRLGDRLVSAVELSDQEQRPENVSEVLCRAAIEQIDREAERYSFNEAVATRKPLIRSLMAILILCLLGLTVDYTPDASSNALKRWAPFSSEKRYTFVEDGGLQVDGRSAIEGIFYVPRGEEFALKSKYSFADADSGAPFWSVLEKKWADASSSAGRADEFLRANLNVQTDLENTFQGVVPDPSQAVLGVGQTIKKARMTGNKVEYNLPGRTKKLELSLRMGDVRSGVAIQPVARPTLDQASAIIEYPSYLKYEKSTTEVHGTVFPYLEGSRVEFKGVTTRGLNLALLKPIQSIGGEIKPQKLTVKGEGFKSEPLDLDDFRELEFAWQDELGIDGSQTWKLTLERQPDNPPHGVDCPGQAPVVAILRDEVLDIRMVAEDDFGLRQLSAEWEVYKRGGTNMVDRGESVLRDFDPRNLSGDSIYLFDPRKLKLEEGTLVNLYAAAKDYYRTDRKKRSLPFQIHILSPEEHAQIIQQNFESKMAELDELARRQENLLEATRETLDQDAEQMKSDQTDKQIGRQEQEQKNIAEKTKELSEDLKELTEEALKNKEMDPQDLAKMAKAQQEMKNLANEQMQQAQQALQQAQQDQQEREENLEKAEEKEKEALDKMKEMQEEAGQNVQDMYANTLVMRLRKIAEFEESVAKDFTENLVKLIGRLADQLPEKLRMQVNDAFANQTINSLKAAKLQTEIARFYDATQSEKFGEVTKLMTEARPSENMDAHADLIRRNQTGKVIEGAQKLAEQFTKWADLLDPKNDGGGEGEGEGGGEPDEDLIERMKELLRLRQAEMDLREQTQKLEAEHTTRKKEQLEEDTFDLRFRQLTLMGDLQLEMDKRGAGEFLGAARYRMRDAEDELNLPGDTEGLIEAYMWAEVARTQAQGDAKKLADIEATLKELSIHLNDKQKANAQSRAGKILEKK